MDGLCIRDINYTSYGDPILAMAYVLQTFPQLACLTLENEYTDPDRTSNSSGDDDQGTGFSLSNLTTTATRHSKLKSFEMTVHILTKSHIDYVTTYLPHTLDKFRLKMTNAESGGWLQDIGEDVADRFAEYLGNNVREVYLQMIRLAAPWYNTTYNGPTSTATSRQTVINYWPFIATLMGRERNHLNCHVSVKMYGMVGHNSNIFLHFHRNQDNILVLYNGCSRIQNMGHKQQYTV